MAFSPFSTLPNEVISEIFSYLDILSKFRARRVCRKWNVLLRERRLYETVILDESWTLQPAYGEYFWYRLQDGNIWPQVKHLVLIGNYDFGKEDFEQPHSGEVPWIESPMVRDLLHFLNRDEWYNSLYDLCDKDFRNLRTVSIRNAAVGIFWLNIANEELSPLNCRVHLENCSLIYFCYALVEFGISQMTLDLRTESAPSLMSVTSLLAPAEIGDIWEPPQIAKMVEESFSALKTENMKDIREKHHTLLRGRGLCTIRPEVIELFEKLFGELAPGEHHWKRCGNYSYDGLSDLAKFALVYYAKPRNVYRCFVISDVQFDFPKEL